MAVMSSAGGGGDPVAPGDPWVLRQGDHGERAIDLREAEALASRRLSGLVSVALELSRAQSVEALTEVVFSRGLAALGADGGAVAVVDGDVLRLTMTPNLPDSARAIFTELPLDAPLPACHAATTGLRVLLPDADTARGWSPEMGRVLRETGCQAWASLPLATGSGLLGSLTVGWRSAHAFPGSEVELLDAFAAQCADGLERIRRRQEEQRAATAVRRMSETLQHSLLTEPLVPGHLEVAVRYRPAAEEAQVGGDWYDAFPTSDGQTCLVVGDVSGHDRDAAAAMGQVRNLLRGIAYTVGDPPAAVLTLLDRAVRDLQVVTLASAVLAKVEAPRSGDPAGFTFRWSNAGHPPPLLVGADGGVRVLRSDADLLLGLDPDTERTDRRVDVPPGATVLLFTDGLVERRDASIDDGLDWLAGAVGRLAGDDLEGLCDLLLAEVDAAAEDDIALLAVRWRPPTG